MEEKRFMNVKEVADYIGISTSMAYKLIRRLNKELAAKGYITVAGRVSKAYFEEKIYAGKQG